MEQKLKTSCTKPNCNCIEIAEQKNGGNPVKSYECLMPNEIESVKTGFQKQAEMTNKQKAQEWFDEWVKGFTIFNHGPVFTKYDAIAFAAFCLDKREKEIGWRKYPDEKPIHGQSCLIWFLNETLEDVWIVDNWLHCYDPSKVIAWMPLPEYKP